MLEPECSSTPGPLMWNTGVGKKQIGAGAVGRLPAAVRHPVFMLIQFPAAPRTTQLPAYAMGKQHKMAQVPRTLPAMQEIQLELLALLVACPNSATCNHLESEPSHK